MNKFIQNLFIWLLPFYPIWSWVCWSFFGKPIDSVVILLLLPITLYLIIYVNIRLPKYLIFLIIFTIYHLSSVFINDSFPKNTTRVYFFMADFNIIACFFFIIIENTIFDEKFISKMNKRVLLIVLISLVVSIIQTKITSFFTHTTNDDDLFYVGQSRCFSIYSWISLNSGGISFPILISILLSININKKPILSLVIISGIVVSFLTSARYVMISAICALSQLFFNSSVSIAKRIFFLGMLLTSIFFIGVVADHFGYDIDNVINERILEKGSDMVSAKARVKSYEVFMIVFPEHPLLGVGPITQKKVIDLLGGEANLIHVGYLSYLYYYGVVGCLLIFFAIFFLLKDAWIVGKKDNFWGIFYGLISFCLANFTFVYFNLSEMGIVISVIYLRYYHCKSNLTLDESLIKTEIQ